MIARTIDRMRGEAREYARTTRLPGVGVISAAEREHIVAEIRRVYGSRAPYISPEEAMPVIQQTLASLRAS